MRTLIAFLRIRTCTLGLGAVFLFGCATPSTVDSRKQERYGAYSQLTDEQRQLVDQGRIKVGMSQDAVYIALGKANEVLQQETQQGATAHWLYYANQLREYHYWSYRGFHGRGRYYSEPYYGTDYYVQPYVKMEVIFQDGLVKEWRTLPAR